MYRNCNRCISKSKSIYLDKDYCLCMNENTYNKVFDYFKDNIFFDKIKRPSCLSVQSAYDGRCPYKQTENNENCTELKEEIDIIKKIKYYTFLYPDEEITSVLLGKEEIKALKIYLNSDKVDSILGLRVIPCGNNTCFAFSKCNFD